MWTCYPHRKPLTLKGWPGSPTGTAKGGGQMINQRFLNLTARHAGHETPDGLYEVCHQVNCFFPPYDLGRIPFLSHLGHTGAAPKPLLYYQLSAHRETLFSLSTPLFNLAYFFTLAKIYKKPIADLHTINIDRENGFHAACILKDEIDTPPTVGATPWPISGTVTRR